MKFSLLSLVFVALCVSTVSAQERISRDAGRTFTVSRGNQGTARASSTAGDAPRRRPPLDPVVLDFNSPPASPWQSWDCLDHVSEATIADGMLTIDAVSCYEFYLLHPDPWHPYGGVWHDYVDNAVGWVIEARLKIDPITVSFFDDRAPITIVANDHTNLVIIGFSTDEIGITYPDQVRVPMNTTGGFRIYRIESKHDRVKVYVDGELRINHKLSWSGEGTDVLDFGDGHIDSRSRSYWDYFMYDVSPKGQDSTTW